jgi:hypothetical protein
VNMFVCILCFVYVCLINMRGGEYYRAGDNAGEAYACDERARDGLNDESLVLTI